MFFLTPLVLTWFSYSMENTFQIHFDQFLRQLEENGLHQGSINKEDLRKNSSLGGDQEQKNKYYICEICYKKYESDKDLQQYFSYFKGPHSLTAHILQKHQQSNKSITSIANGDNIQKKHFVPHVSLKKSSQQKKQIKKHPFADTIEGVSYQRCHFCKAAVLSPSKHLTNNHQNELKHWINDNKSNQTKLILIKEFPGYFHYNVINTKYDLFECKSCNYICMYHDTIKIHTEKSH